MKQEALNIQQQESVAAVAALAATESNQIEPKCPYARNGIENHDITDPNGTEDTAIVSVTNGIAPTSVSAPVASDKPMGLGSFKVAKIETVKENLVAQSLTVQQINDYCKSLFIFKNIRVMRFK